MTTTTFKISNLLRPGPYSWCFLALGLLGLLWPFLYKTYWWVKPRAAAPQGEVATVIYKGDDYVLAYRMESSKRYKDQVLYTLYVNNLTEDKSTYGSVTFDCNTQEQRMTSIYLFERADYRGSWHYSLQPIQIGIVLRLAPQFYTQLNALCQS